MDRLTTSASSSAISTSAPAASSNPSPLHPDRIKYLAALDAWTGKEANGFRAAEKIKQWLDDGKADATLNLSQLELRSLPPLPNNLKRLKADKNQLADIPENHLPVLLEALDVHGNQLTSLPASLPIAQLKVLNVADNHLDSLPPAALMLDPECKVSFWGNNLDSTLLTRQFGPEQNRNGMRQMSTAGEFLARQAEAVATLTTVLAYWSPSGDLGLPLCTHDLQGMTSFTDILKKMQLAPFVKNAELREAIVELIKKMATDSTLCAKIFSRTILADNPDHHQLAQLFFEIRYLAIVSDAKNGCYNGRLPEFVEVIRQKFRGDAISHWVFDRLKPEVQNLPSSQNKAWGDIATFISPFIKLDLKIEPVDTTNSSSSFDIIELSQIIPNHIKYWENKYFPTYFSNRESSFSNLIRIIDPKIGEIMENDLDANGNKLNGNELNLLHAEQINDYFARIGQPNLLGQVWPSIADPTKFSLDLDKGQVTISDQVDLSQLNPEHRAALEKCLIQ